MAALVCDLCGGKLVMGTGGIAVCDNCGMEYSADRIKEKIQEMKGAVPVDNSHMIENYLEMAQIAKDADNNAEAESYCNKILEIDPTNYRAWMLKGEAAAWQSTLKNSRVDEGVAAFIKAINNAPDDVKDELVEKAKGQIEKLTVAMISLRADRFAKWPDEEETNGFISDLTSILNTETAFITQFRVPIKNMAPIATCINQSVVQAWKNVIWPDYNGDPNDSDDRAGKSQWQKFIKRVGYCTTLLEQAILLCDQEGKDNEDNIQRYENLIYLHKQAIDSCSWDYNFTSQGKSWHKKWMLTDEAKNIRRGLIRDYEAKIEAIKASKEQKAKEAAQKRFDDYWVEHADEKAALETERATLEEQITTLRVEISNIPGNAEKENIQERINALTVEMNSLGLFKGKEKKAIQEKIDAANLELKNVVNQIDAATKEIEKKIDLIKQRITEINTELTKER